MEDNVKSFLEKVQELNDKKITVYPKSVEKTLKATPITFKQQKEVIGTIADGVVGGLKLQKIINDIILENVETGDVELDLRDKLAIIIELRIASIGDTLKTSSDISIDLNPILEKVKGLSYNRLKTLKYNTLEVLLALPTLKEENKIINTLITTVKKGNDDEISKNVGNIYTYEICKYIHTIKIGELNIEFKDTPIKDRFKIVENLPLTVNKDIILFIQEVRTLESEALTYLDGGETKSFDIDVSFFDS